MKCPKCEVALKAVPPSRHLNSEQWDATKAGDYYRETWCCTASDCIVNDTGANPAYRYVRERELEKFNDAEAAARGW